MLTMSSPGFLCLALRQLHRVPDQLARGAQRVVFRELGVVPADHLVGPVEQLVAVLQRNSEKPGDGLQRQFARYLKDEVTGELAGGLGGDALCPLVEVGAEPLDCAWRESAGDDLTQPGVLGVVHHQHGELGRLDLSLDVHCRVEVGYDGLGRRREHVTAQRHLADVAVLADDPEAAVAEAAHVGWLLVPPDRRRPPHLG